MDKTTVYNKDGKAQNINKQYLQGYLNSGWTTQNLNIGNKTITPNDINKSVPVTQVIPPKANLGAVGMSEELTANAQANQDQYTQDLELKSKTAETQKSSSLEDLVSGLTNQKGETQLQDEVYKNTVDPLEGELKDINQQIFSEQQAVRRKLEELDKNPQGLFGGALADEKNRIQTESLKKQADLSVIQMGIQGKYDSAKAIADRAIQVQLEKQKNAVEALRLNYEDKKDMFTKAEQREFETKQSARERDLDTEEKRLTKASDMIINALSLKAPTSLIAKANTLVSEGAGIIEIANALGKYSGDYLSNEIKRASLNKTNTEIDKLKAEIKASETPIETSGLPNTTGGIATRLLASAKNDKQLDATERQQLSKARTVIGQIDSLQGNIAKQNKTGLIKGKTAILMEKIGLNADAGVINAQLQALTPNLARGIYGEVGVLTDNDVRLYRTTLPRLDRPQDQNDAVLALTLRTVQKSIENTLTGAANSGIDVSGWTQDYVSITKQITDIEDRIGISKAGVDELISQDPSLAPMIKEMYQNNMTDGEILEVLNAR